MKTSAVVLGLVAAAAAAPQVAERADCSSSYNGNFEITVFKNSKRDVEKRASCSGKGALVLSLEGGVLKDAKGRTGYIASNYQFQFDGPPQAGAKQVDGFSVCADGKLALDGKTEFFQCLSGDFNNLYSKSWAAQCEPVIISAMSCGSASSSGVSQVSDGQPQAPSTAGSPPVTQISDGQPQGPSTAANPPVTQISDGQPQAPTGAPITQISDGQIQVPPSAPAPPPVTQISDGQPQAPTGAPVTQISDGQPQAPTGKPVSQISDGQPQAPTGAPVTQISDGQPQAPTGAPVTQISDGQPQAPTGAPVTQISDGQVQAPTSVGTIVPTGTASPTFVPPNAAGQVIPGTSAALFIAALGAVLYL